MLYLSMIMVYVCVMPDTEVYCLLGLLEIIRKLPMFGIWTKDNAQVVIDVFVGLVNIHCITITRHIGRYLTSR